MQTIIEQTLNQDESFEETNENIRENLIIPPEFYYADPRKKKSRLDWSYRPPGKPDFIKAFQGKPWWRRLNRISDLSPKIICLNDWNSTALHIQNDAVRQFLHFLLHKQFVVVFIMRGEIIELTPLLINFLITEPFCIDYETTHTILHKASQKYQCDPETILVLDGYELNRICHQKPLFHELTIDDLFQISLKKRTLCIQEFIDSARPKQLVLKNFKRRSTKLFHRIDNATEIAEKILTIESITLETTEQIEQLIATKSLTMHQLTLHETQLSTIYTVFLRNVPLKNIQLLIDLVQLFPALEEIQFFSVKINDFAVDSMQFCNLQLTTLKIHHSPISLSGVITLLNLFSIGHCELDEYLFAREKIVNIPLPTSLYSLVIKNSILDINQLLYFNPEKILDLRLKNTLFTLDASNTANIIFSNLHVCHFYPASTTNNLSAIFTWFLTSMPALQGFSTQPFGNYYHLLSQNQRDPAILYNFLETIFLQNPRLLYMSFGPTSLKRDDYQKTLYLLRQLPLQMPFQYDFPKPPVISKVLNRTAQKRKTAKKPTCPLHDASRSLHVTHFREPFIFQPLKKADRSQRMIIQKISQYLILKQKKLDLIPIIQRGICSKVVTKFVNSKDLQTWDHEIDLMLAWNGTNYTLDLELTALFEGWVALLETSSLNIRYFIGDALEYFLANLQKTAIFTNHNHRICIVPHPNQQWLFFNPSHPEGHFEIDHLLLANTLHQHLGPLISIVQRQPLTIKPQVHNTRSFMREGGLLLFNRIMNSSDISLNLYNLDAESLNYGFRMRNTNGVPAWITLFLKETHLALAFHLLTISWEKNPVAFSSALKQSVDALSPQKIQEYTEIILKYQTHNMVMARHLCAILKASPLPHYYQKKLQTWNTPHNYASNLESWCANLINNKANTIRLPLVKLESVADLECLSLHLEAYLRRLKIDFFVITSVKDLICNAPFIQKKGNQGIVRPGPGGPLHDFLVRNSEHPAFLIIHYSAFQSLEELSRSQSLFLPHKPHADGTFLPSGLKIIGLISDPIPTSRKTWFSQFDAEICPFKGNALHKNFPVLSFSKDIHETKIHRIDLYGGIDWQEQLLGDYVFDPVGFQCIPGKLIEPLQSCVPIVFCNPPQDEGFQKFFRKALIRGHIEIDNQLYPFIQNTLYMTEGYDWKILLENTDWRIDFLINNTVYTLNPWTLEHFYKHMRGKQASSGYLKLHENNTLLVNLTRNLDIHAWGQLLQTCQKLSIKLKIYYAPDICLDEAMASCIPHEMRIIQPVNPESTEIYVSTDMDATVAKLSAQPDDGRIVINISDAEPQDLMPVLDVHFQTESGAFIFNQPEPLLINALAENRQVILYGTFSDDLVDAIMDLLLTRNRQKNLTGKLYLVSNKATFPGFVSTIDNQHDAIKEPFIAAFPVLAEYAHEPYNILRAKAKWLQHHPFSNPENAWLGLYDVPPKEPLQPFDPENSHENADRYWQNKVQTFLEAIKNQSYVLLTGISGVGKTTLVQRFLPKSWKLFQGRKNLQACLDDTSGQVCVYFEDEVDMSPDNINPESALARFEGLLHSPPGIRGQSQYHFLKDRKIIFLFAKNPFSYGGERAPPCDFLKNHGNCLLLTPLPPDYLYEYVLKQLFENTPYNNWMEVICTLILEAWCFIYSVVPHEIALSTRELQTMALMMIGWMKTQTKLNHHTVDHMTRYFIYTLAVHAVPAAAMEEFKKIWYREDLSFIQPAMHTDFLLTASRMEAWGSMHHWFNQHQLRIQQNIDGGLRGLILIGETKTGKFTLLNTMFKMRGYSEIMPNQPLPINKRRFCIIPPACEQKVEYLRFAFHAGAIAVMLQWNTDSLQESTLNALLMGKTPEGQDPDTPGFMMIGLQHHTINQELQCITPALQRRTAQIYLEDYSTRELESLLTFNNIQEDIAASMVKIYQESVTYARKNRHTPPDLQLLLMMAREAHHLTMGHSPGSTRYAFFPANTARIEATQPPQLNNVKGIF